MKTTKKTTKKSGTKRNQMSPALRTSCSKIRRLMNTGNTSDAETKYQISVEVLAVKKDQKKYGKRSVERLAVELGCTAALLYAYARVANAWTEKQFTALTKKTNAKGDTLTFWHFVVIARAKTAELRQTLLNETLTKSLSAGKMERKTTGSKGGALQQLHFTVARTAAKVAKLLTRCDAETASADLVSELEAAAIDVAAAQKEFDAMMEKVTGRLDAFKTALAVPSSSPRPVNGAHVIEAPQATA